MHFDFQGLYLYVISSLTHPPHSLTSNLLARLAGVQSGLGLNNVRNVQLIKKIIFILYIGQEIDCTACTIQQRHPMHGFVGRRWMHDEVGVLAEHLISKPAHCRDALCIMLKVTQDMDAWYGACMLCCHRESPCETLEVLKRDVLALGLRFGVRSACALGGWYALCKCNTQGLCRWGCLLRQAASLTGPASSRMNGWWLCHILEFRPPLQLQTYRVIVNLGHSIPKQYPEQVQCPLWVPPVLLSMAPWCPAWEQCQCPWSQVYRLRE